MATYYINGCTTMLNMFVVLYTTDWDIHITVTEHIFCIKVDSLMYSLMYSLSKCDFHYYNDVKMTRNDLMMNCDLCCMVDLWLNCDLRVNEARVKILRDDLSHCK